MSVHRMILLLNRTRIRKAAQPAHAARPPSARGIGAILTPSDAARLAGG